MTLGDYLAECARKKHEYGVHDCCTLPADWAVLNGWPDPMADWRAGYIDASPAHEGLLSIFTAGMDGAGIPRAETALEGDVGVINVFGLEAGAIFTGKRWALVAPRGMAFTTADPSIAQRIWRVKRG